MNNNKHLTFAGWVIIIGLLYAFSKSRTGYNAIYYSLILILVLLLVGQYQKINSISFAGGN